MLLLPVKYLLPGLLFFAACVQQPNTDNRLPDAGTGQLIPINFADSNYLSVDEYARDTVSPDGWSVRYFVRDDSTRYSDIYIEWSKGNRKGIFHGADVLLFRRYFIPVYVGENDTHLFLEHACATTCSAVLTLSKDSISVYRDFFNVVDYDITFGKVVFVNDASRPHDTLAVSVVDLAKKKEQTIIFRNVCMLLPEYGCIDSVDFEKEQVKLFATLVDRSDSLRQKNVREDYIVKFGR